MEQLQYIEFDHFELSTGRQINFRLTYQVYGRPLGDAPVVLVNHALTGNSELIGERGWWNAIVGKGKTIDTSVYSVLVFNCPGNGFGAFNESFLEFYKEFKARDIARIFSEGLSKIGIYNLFAIIGASVGGGITWELAALRPKLAEYIIPVACDWKSTDWVIGNCYIQDAILNNSSKPLEDARMHAMTFYRTPESFKEKFNRKKSSDANYNVENWLSYHGKRLSDRFQVSAYKMMNQILKTIDVTKDTDSFSEMVKRIEGHIHIITINSDLLFKTEENWETFIQLKAVKESVSIGEIKSIHGHDAFLIEHRQLSRLLKSVFNSKKTTKNDNHKSHYIRNW